MYAETPVWALSTHIDELGAIERFVTWPDAKVADWHYQWVLLRTAK